MGFASIHSDRPNKLEGLLFVFLSQRVIWYLRRNLDPFLPPERYLDPLGFKSSDGANSLGVASSFQETTQICGETDLVF